MTSSNGNICRATGSLCGEFTGHRWIPHTKASDAELWCFPWNKRWTKQLRRRWSETPSRSLWLHCNDISVIQWYQSVLALSLGIAMCWMWTWGLDNATCPISIPINTMIFSSKLRSNAWTTTKITRYVWLFALLPTVCIYFISSRRQLR